VAAKIGDNKQNAEKAESELNVFTGRFWTNPRNFPDGIASAAQLQLPTHKF